MIICDFCSSPDVTRRYRAKSFVDPARLGISDGDWAACDVCADLVDGEHWKALENRSIETFPGGVDEAHEVPMRIYIASLHRKFRENRIL